MKRQMIAVLSAAALALSTASTPAFAGDRDKDVLKLLLGVAAVGLLINEVNKKKVTPAPQPEVRDRKDKGHYHGHQDRGWHGDNRWKRHQDRTVPAQCVFSITGPRGRQEVVSSRCMNELGLGRVLPERCSFPISTGWGNRYVYGTQCLQDRGYRIGRR